MDCRKPAVLAVGLFLGGLGCTHLQKLPETPDALPPGAEVRKEADKPARQPQPATLVAYGNLHERSANEPDVPQANRDMMLDQARKSYQQALKVDPKYIPAMLALARLYEARDDHARALAMYDQALRLNPKDAGIWCDLGMCRARRKEWGEAITALRKATELDPENKQYSNYLGFTLARAGQFDESYNAFRKTQGEAVAHYNVARMLNHVGQTELGKQHLRLALQADPKMAQAQQLLAQLENPNPNAIATAPAEDNAVAPAGLQAPANSPSSN
jgi:tetratricopeptide (TPR) repeat protein